jgi:hypothetical protein
VCSSKGIIENPTFCKQVLWISISSLFGIDIKGKGIQEWGQVDWNQNEDYLE